VPSYLRAYPSRLQRRYLARRLEILRAAGREFRTRGYAETGMREIAAAADLSLPPISTTISAAKTRSSSSARTTPSTA